MMGGVDPPSDEHITMLLSMGFTDIEYIRKALQLAKNDLNEAVAILTGEVNRGNLIKYLLLLMLLLLFKIVLSIFHHKLKIYLHSWIEEQK